MEWYRFRVTPVGQARTMSKRQKVMVKREREQVSTAGGECHRGERQQPREPWALPTPPPFPVCTSLQAAPLFLQLCYTQTLHFKYHLWSLQGQTGICQAAHPEVCGGTFLFQFPASCGCLSLTPWDFIFHSLAAETAYACTLLALNIWYMLPGQLVESSGLYPRNWLFDHRLIRVGKYHFWNDSLLQTQQQSHFSSWGTHFKEPDGAYAVAELCLLPPTNPA